MKSIIVITLVLLSSFCFANQQDTTNRPKVDSSAIKQLEATVQAINFVINDMKTIIRRSKEVTDDELLLLYKMIDVYIKEKNTQFNPPKSKNK